MIAMGVFWAAVVGALVGAIGTGAVTWLIQKRAWEHELEVRQEERRLSVMPYITFRIGKEPTSKTTTPEGKMTFMRFPRVTVRNDGLGPAKFTPVDVMDSFKDAIQRRPVPDKGLTPLGLPVHLNAGETFEIDLVVKDLDGLEAPGGTKHDFEFCDMYGNRYSSEVCVYTITNQQGAPEWLISAALPQVKAATPARDRGAKG